jgi:hypothetical protein
MIKYPIIFLILLNLLSCKQSNKTSRASILESDTIDQAVRSKIVYRTGEKKTLIFDFNNNSNDSFGYMIYEEDPEVFGPAGIVVIDKYIYLMDKFHSSLKRIDALTGKLTTSAQIQIDNHLPYWLAGFNGNIYMTTYSDTIYVFSQDLEIVDKILISPIGRFYGESDKTLKVWFPEEKRIAEINKSNEVINDEPFEGRVSNNGYYNGKKYDFDGNSLHWGDFIVDCASLDYTKGYLYDFNKKFFVYYKADRYYDNNPKPLEIYVHEIN